MKPLHIEASDETPGVRFDKDAGIFEIFGRSLPEDSVEFYDPVFNWLRDYGQSPNAATPFTFKLDYFNTSSSKIILDLLKLLSEISGASVLWYSMEEDEDVAEAGEEFAQQVDIPFTFKTY